MSNSKLFAQSEGFSYFSLVGLENSGIANYEQKTITGTIPFDDGQGNNITNKGQYASLIANIYKADGKLDKPFIIFNGIRIADTLDRKSFLWRNRLLFDSLWLKNYDIILVDYVYAPEFIQRHAMAAVEVIDWVNKNKTSLTPNIVMGYSMGGLVTRYALAYMEKNNIPSHTQMYVSHDAPHKGANVPIGLQELIGLTKNYGFLGNVLNTIGNSFNHLTPAVQQMLVYHYMATKTVINLKYASPHPKKIAFFEDLKNLNPDFNGYPSKLKKIAVANGSLNGTRQFKNDNLTPYGSGEQFFSYRFKQVMDGGFSSCTFTIFDWMFNTDKFKECKKPKKVKMTVYDDVIEVKAGLNAGSYVSHLGGLMLDEKYAYFWSNKDYDYIAGSYQDNIKDIYAVITTLGLTVGNQNKYSFGVTNYSFIPTFSALDMNKGTEYKFENSTTYFNYSPFDKFLAEQNNESHSILTRNGSSFISSEITKNEFITVDENIVLNGKNLDQNRKDLILATKKISSGTGEYKVSSGAGLQLIAGEEVVLSNLNIENGAYFEMGIKSVKLSGQKSKNLTYYPHFVYPYIPNTMRLESNARIEKTEDSTSQLTQETDKIQIFPNPNSGIFKIRFDSNNENKVEIYNSTGMLIFQNLYNDLESEINIIAALNGIYNIRITTPNGISKHKIIIQYSK